MFAREEMQGLTQHIIHSYEDRAAGIAQLKQAVNTHLRAAEAQLKELDDAHRAMGTRLSAGLARGVADLKQGVGTVLQGFDSELREIRSAQAGARDEWRKMTATMQAKRGQVAGGVKTEAVAPSPSPAKRHARKQGGKAG